MRVLSKPQITKRSKKKLVISASLIKHSISRNKNKHTWNFLVTAAANSAPNKSALLRGNLPYRQVEINFAAALTSGVITPFLFISIKSKIQFVTSSDHHWSKLRKNSVRIE